MNRETIIVEGMTCGGCALRIETAVLQLAGVKSVRADFKKNSVAVEFDAPATSHGIAAAIRNAGYDVAEKKADGMNAVCLLVIIFGLYAIARRFGLTAVFRQFPTVGEARADCALLFAIGLLSSVHCVAMCGGISLAQNVAGAEPRSLKKNVLYNAGRLTGYAAVGGILGVIGEAAAITLRIRGIIGIIAGACMVLTGAAMLGACGLPKKLAPRLPKCVAVKVAAFGSRSSFAVGLANAFMPCGPLQSMQLYAVASGGFLAGAASLFFFCLGTIPLLLAFGTAAGALRKKQKALMLKAGAALVLVFGLYMLQNNLALTGISIPALSSGSGGAAVTSRLDGGKQYLSTSLRANGYDDLNVKSDIPVVWTIAVDENDLNGCNNEIILPQYNLQIKLHAGENVVEFTPTKKGSFVYSCWMGMLKNTVFVE